MAGCKIEGCIGSLFGGGYCHRHYAQVFKYGKTFKRTRYDPNEIIVKGNIAEVVLYDKNCKEKARAIIDREDVEKVNVCKWSLSTNGYVVTISDQKRFGIQHAVLGAIPDRKKQVDHKDRNKLNNRKGNLRFCPPGGNVMNRPKQKHNQSGYKGVTRHGSNWGVSIRAKNVKYWLGTFKSKIEAAKIYNAACLKHHGEFACLNEDLV